VKDSTRELIIKSFHVTEVVLGQKTSLNGSTLTVDASVLEASLLPDFVETVEV